MKNFIYPIIFPILLTIFYALTNKLKMKQNNKEKKIDNFMANIHDYVFWLGLVGTLMFSTFFIIACFSEKQNSLFNIITFGIFLLLGFLILIYSVRCKIIVKHDQMIITPFIGKNKIVKFNEITDVKNKTFGKARSYVIYANNKKVLEIDGSTYTNYNLFVKKLLNENIIK